ncbi:Ohr family peroxiredoxin [Mesorhizobium caraganae]|uniref:Ohr family peroxiredoxin n=1 Tax=Mesorhizobium caraganae TaxID=483206 RepID=UPI003ED03D2F
MSHIARVVYTARTATTGSRENGASRSSDGLLDIWLSTPGSPRIGTNPEQLLAAGWSASFASAIASAAHERKIALPAGMSIEAEVNLNYGENGHFLSVQLDIAVPSLERDVVQILVDEAREICPYSKATRGNIDVIMRIV